MKLKIVKKKGKAEKKIVNWTKLKTEQNWKFGYIENLNKIEKWTKLKNEQNCKAEKIVNWTKLKTERN